VEDGVLVAGLGNPGPQYAKNRHNYGYLVLDEMAASAGVAGWQEKFSGQFLRTNLAGNKLLLLKPMTYMNLSGRSVARAVHFFRIPVENVIVIHDDLDLPYDEIRIKKGGGTAGHKGIASIAQELGDTGFVRVRMGIGRPVHGEVVNYVLDNFSIEENATLVENVIRGSEVINCIVSCGLTTAMNRFNKRGGKS
jgi:PTH1 family peptidyl-tRNA hydrolase